MDNLFFPYREIYPKDEIKEKKTESRNWKKQKQITDKMKLLAAMKACWKYDERQPIIGRVHRTYYLLVESKGKNAKIKCGAPMPAERRKIHANEMQCGACFELSKLQ